MTTAIESPAVTREPDTGLRNFAVYVVQGRTPEGFAKDSAGWVQIAVSGFPPGDDWDDEFGPAS